MIINIVLFVVGLLVGVWLALQTLPTAERANSRRILARLQNILDGLESAYQMEAATLDAQREIAGLPKLLTPDVESRIHVPQKVHHDDKTESKQS